MPVSLYGSCDMCRVNGREAKSVGVPHPSVDSTQFYHHISSSTPEPIRARHLLVYCFDRAAKTELEPPKKPKSKTRKTDGARTDEGDRILQDIMAEFSRSLGQGEIETNVFGSGVSPFFACSGWGRGLMVDCWTI